MVHQDCLAAPVMLEHQDPTENPAIRATKGHRADLDRRARQVNRVRKALTEHRAQEAAKAHRDQRDRRVNQATKVVQETQAIRATQGNKAVRAKEAHQAMQVPLDHQVSPARLVHQVHQVKMRSIAHVHHAARRLKVGRRRCNLSINHEFHVISSHI